MSNATTRNVEVLADGVRYAYCDTIVREDIVNHLSVE